MTLFISNEQHPASPTNRKICLSHVPVVHQWTKKNTQINKPLRLTLIIGESFISSRDLYIDKCVSLNVK